MVDIFALKWVFIIFYRPLGVPSNNQGFQYLG